MEPNKLDTWLNEQLGDYSAELPADSWSGFQASRKKKKRRFIVWFLLAGTAASLTLGFFLDRNSINEPVLVNQMLQIDNQAKIESPQNAALIPESTESEEAIVETDKVPEAAPVYSGTIKSALPTKMVKSPKTADELPQQKVIEAKTKSLEIPNEQAKINFSESPLAFAFLPQKKASNKVFGEWRIGIEANRAAIKTKGRGVNADLYNEVYSKQKLAMNSLRFGIERVYHLNKNLRLSGGLYFALSAAKGQIQIDKIDTNSQAFQNWSLGSGGGNMAVESLTSSSTSNFQVSMKYSSLEIPFQAQYYLPVGRWGGFIAGAGLRLHCNFNEKINWYTINPNNQDVGSSQGDLKNFSVSKEFNFGWEQSFNPRRRFSLIYSLKLPQKELYKNTKYSIGRAWEHGIKLQYVIP